MHRRRNATIKESCREEWDVRSGGCEQREFFMKPVFLLLAQESVKGKGGAHAEENEHVSRSIEGWEEDSAVFMYTPVFTVN